MVQVPASQSNTCSPHAYAVLRRGGASPGSARRQLALAAPVAARLEAAFSIRALRHGGEETSPRFARHEAHVARVMAEGGFPTLSERRNGKNGACVGLPLTWPPPLAATARRERR